MSSNESNSSNYSLPEPVQLDPVYLQKMQSHLGPNEFADLQGGLLYMKDGTYTNTSGKNVNIAYSQYQDLLKKILESDRAYGSLLEATKNAPGRAANIIGGKQTSLLGG